jgi:phospholipase/lecithinase/hemolysin
MEDFLISRDAATAQHAVNNMAHYVCDLYAAGARDFLVPNLLDLSLTPFGSGLPPAEQASLYALSVGFNNDLDSALSNLAGLPGVNITPFDTLAFVHSAVANPAAYGFTNVTTPCLDAVTGPCAAPDEFLYWDGVHPTTRAHELLGEQFYGAVAAEPAPVPEPASLLLVGTGLVGLRAWKRRQ